MNEFIRNEVAASKLRSSMGGILTRATCVVLLWLVPSEIVGQESESVPSSSADAALTVDMLEERAQAIEADAGLDDLSKSSLLDSYRTSVDALNEAARFRQLRDGFEKSIEDAPESDSKLRLQIEELEKAGDSTAVEGVNATSSVQDIEDTLSRERVELKALEAERTKLNEQLAELENRPAALAERLVAARAELSSTQNNIDGVDTDNEPNTDRVQLAKLAELRAQNQRLAEEVAMLEREDLSYDGRLSLINTSLRLVNLRVDVQSQKIASLEEAAESRIANDLTNAENLIKMYRSQPERDPVSDRLVEELEALVRESRTVAADVEATLRTRKNRGATWEETTRRFQETKQQVELGGLEEFIAPALLEQLTEFPSRWVVRKNRRELKATFADARRGLFMVEKASQPSMENGELDPKVENGIDSNEQIPAEHQQLEDTREALRNSVVQVRSDLRLSYQRLIRGHQDLDLLNRQIEQESAQDKAYLLEKLFWARSSPLVGLETFRYLPDGIKWAFGPARFRELIGHLGSIPIWYYSLATLAVTALVLTRRRMNQSLMELGVKTRRVSSDQYIFTVKALLLTGLLAAPGAVALAFLGWGFLRQAGASAWSLSLGANLIVAAASLFFLVFVVRLCRRRGLAEMHFNWSEELRQRISKSAIWLILTSLPLGVAVNLVLTEVTASRLHSAGRLGVILVAVVLWLTIAWLMHPEKGVFAMVHRQSPKSLLGRLRKVWFALVLIEMGLITVLGIVGYVITALILTIQVQLTLAAVMIAAIVYSLLLRWFSMKERKLALAERLEERRARAEAPNDRQDDEKGPFVASDEIGAPPISEDEEMDLDTVGEQTRRLLKFVVGVGLVTVLWLIWTRLVPVLSVLNHVRVLGVSITDITVASLIVAMTIAAARNLPGLLEVMIFRRMNTDVGTRNAYTSLAKYIVVAIGAVILFQSVNIGWSKFGWIAAALSVGLGFGLQEVVANFVCGIILLFERPIRVGDIVSLSGVDGVVTRIRIRATTITDWDRKELVVPNKQLITGTLVNWTLSSSINRVTIVVGVAYGCDVEKARQILLDVARDHPVITADPPPVATFEEFSASSLKLLLRCYLPDMENRLSTISELHSEIDRRFKNAGIEIAFPQLDLHLRGGQLGQEI